MTMTSFSRGTGDNNSSHFQSSECLSAECEAVITTEGEIFGISSQFLAGIDFNALLHLETPWS